MNNDVKNFLLQLKKRSIAPENIQFSSWGNWTIVSSFNEIDDCFISERVSTGIDKNPKVALAKSLTEFCERRVFRLSEDKAIKSSFRSDGLAAFPCFLPDGRSIVRKNSYNEAVERYLWATWWDDPSVYFEIKDIDHSEIGKLKKEFDVVKLSVINIYTENSDTVLSILLAENNNGGVVTGGAAGDEFQLAETYSRAFGELLRHLIVIKRMSENNLILQEISFYEQRLWGFGSGSWSEVVTSRLKIRGSRKIVLPTLLFDQEITHGDSDLFIVHRCLFKNQPTFIGGEVDRLCI